MLVKIDIRQIIRDHMLTLYDYGTKKKSWADLALFFGVPVAAAAVFVSLGLLLGSASAGTLITALSIFAGLLFNLLILAHGMLRNAEGKYRDEKVLIQEIYSNISYAILVSLLSITVLLGTIFPGPRWAAQLGSAVAYFLIVNFLLTLFMVLRRVHVLLANEFGRG